MAAPIAVDTEVFAGLGLVSGCWFYGPAIDIGFDEMSVAVGIFLMRYSYACEVFSCGEKAMGVNVVGSALVQFFGDD